jgi:hypothetical protein
MVVLGISHRQCIGGMLGIARGIFIVPILTMLCRHPVKIVQLRTSLHRTAAPKDLEALFHAPVSPSYDSGSRIGFCY